MGSVSVPPSGGKKLPDVIDIVYSGTKQNVSKGTLVSGSVRVSYPNNMGPLNYNTGNSITIPLNITTSTQIGMLVGLTFRDYANGHFNSSIGSGWPHGNCQVSWSLKTGDGTSIGSGSQADSHDDGVNHSAARSFNFMGDSRLIGKSSVVLSASVSGNAQLTGGDSDAFVNESSGLDSVVAQYLMIDIKS